jgi:hypothetical protein
MTPIIEISAAGTPLYAYDPLGHTWQALGVPDLPDGWYANTDDACDVLGPFATEHAAAEALHAARPIRKRRTKRAEATRGTT